MIPRRFALAAASLALLASFGASPQKDPEARVADEIYPPESAKEVIRFVYLETGAPDVAAMNAALHALNARVEYGPRTSDTRRGRAFFAVRAPFDAPASKIESAARKGGGVAHELVCTAFEGRDDRDSKVVVAGFNLTSRDLVMGMSGDVVWFDSAGGWSQFYSLPSKLPAKEIIDRYAKLYAPYGGGQIGRVVREKFTWTLPSAPDKARAEKLLKAMRKLEGVLSATIDGATLAIEVALENLRASGVAGAVPAGNDAKDELDSAGLRAPRASFSTRPVWNLLEADGLAPLPAKKKEDEKH
jgi:hypothetical protein